MLPTTLRFSLWAFAFCIAFIPTHAQQNKNAYDSLYAKAYRLANTQPDSAIHYANLASRATQKKEEQAKAHWLIGFYARKQGYYGLAIERYQKAYDLYTETSQKAVILKNIAFCYKQAGNNRKATSIATKAVENFTILGDSTSLVEAFNLLANCYVVDNNFGDAQRTFVKAFRLAQKQKTKRLLANIYDDFSRLKEKQTQYDSAINYQRLALESFVEPNLSKKCVRLIRLAWYYILYEDTAKARQCLEQAQQLKQNGAETNILLEAIQGFLLFLERKETQARQAIERSDSLLMRLSQHSPSLVQQKFARKLSYELNQNGYKLLKRLWFYSEQRARFAPHKEWFAQRLAIDRQRYQDIRINVALKDSLEIARANPKIKAITQIAPWWWVVMVATLAIAAIWIYNARSQAANARAQETQAHADFVAAIEASPVKGIGHISKAEASMLAEIEHRQKNKLTPDEIKLFLLVVRGYTYKTIAVQTVFTEGNIKTKVRRAKKACGVDSLKELM